jgi:hypothetical protein
MRAEPTAYRFNEEAGRRTPRELPIRATLSSWVFIFGPFLRGAYVITVITSIADVKASIKPYPRTGAVPDSSFSNVPRL